MANNTNSNPKYIDTAGEIITNPTMVLSMKWVSIDANGDDLVIKDTSAGNTLYTCVGQAGVDQFVINTPTVIPKLYVSTIDSGILEITVA